MSEGRERDPLLDRAAADLVRSAQPSGDWQAKVWARIASEPSRASLLRRLRIWQVATGLLAACVAALVLFAYQKSGENDRIESVYRKDLLELEHKVAGYQQEIDELIAQKDAETAKIVAARSAEERAAAMERQALIDKSLVAKRKSLSEARDAARKSDERSRVMRSSIKKSCASDDPLCGL